MIHLGWHPIYRRKFNHLLSTVFMDAIVSQLKKDFQSKLGDTYTSATESGASLLTREELSELEAAWVQLIVWKQKNVNA
ncbi:hypothetical protein [Vibrio sp. HN007]|uniref:hypothetical protein n=1 Tax=Vibrio iocasae TaxID=3098914 RepID=UPI0035D43336